MTTEFKTSRQRVIESSQLQLKFECTISGLNCSFCYRNDAKKLYLIVFQDNARYSELTKNEETWNACLKAMDDEAESQHLADDRCVLFILDSDSTNIPLQLIEGNQQYGRNYVFTPDEAITFLNGVARVDLSEAEHVDPLQTWENILKQVDLTACLTENYFRKKVTLYLQGNPFNATIPNKEQRFSGSVPSVDRIVSMEAGTYRKFCLGEKMSILNKSTCFTVRTVPENHLFLKVLNLA